jgi:hypothetical protein
MVVCLNQSYTVRLVIVVRMIIDAIKALKAKAVRQQESQALSIRETNRLHMLIPLFASATSNSNGGLAPVL